jgi:hypothetical protein
VPNANPIARIRRIDWAQPSVIVLVLANAFPLAGVFLFHWEVFPLLFLFWAENVIIGILNVAKMLLAGGIFEQSIFRKLIQTRVAEGRHDDFVVDGAVLSVFSWMGKICLSIFFCVHYGMFTFVHGTILMAIFGGSAYHTEFLNPSLIVQVVRDNHLAWPIFGLVASHVFSFGYDYLWRGEFRQTNVMVQMTRPYGRIIALHVTILIGGFLLMALHSPVAGLALLVVLKTVFDLAGHQKEREKFSPVAVTAPAAVESQEPVACPDPVTAARLKKALRIAGCAMFVILFATIAGAWIIISRVISAPDHSQTMTVTTDHSSSAAVAIRPASADDPWTLDLGSRQISSGPALGLFRGEYFSVSRANYRNGTLRIRSGTGDNTREWQITFPTTDEETLDNKSYIVSPQDGAGTNSTRIAMTWNKGATENFTQSYDSGYAMKLEFGGREQNTVSTRIYLCVPDTQKSYLDGSFKTNVRKSRADTADGQ